MNDSTLDIKAFLDKDEQKDLLRLLTAGSVDDGKSTLIGRLLFDSKKLYEDQLDALERDSKRMGNAGDHIDYALLLDGLKAEREQGITIDVAYRYFSTNNRKFIIATPTLLISSLVMLPAIALTPSTSVVARDAIIATTSSAICTVPMLSSSFNTRFFLSISLSMIYVPPDYL